MIDPKLVKIAKQGSPSQVLAYLNRRAEPSTKPRKRRAGTPPKPRISNPLN